MSKESREKRKKQIEERRKQSGQSYLRMVLPVVLAAVISIVTIVLSLQPKRYDLKVDDVAPETIKATREIEDTVSTQRLIDEAVESVDVRYTEDEQALQEVLDGMKDFTQACKDVRKTAADEQERWRQQELNRLVAAAQREDPDASPDDFRVDMDDFEYTDAFLRNLVSMLPEGATQEQVQALLALSSEEFEVYTGVLNTCVENIMRTGVKESMIASARELILEDFRTSVPAYDEELYVLAEKAVQKNVKANLLLDTEALEAARQKAIESVTPITYKKGEIIVEEGKRVTEEQYEVLRSLSLVQNDGLNIRLYVTVSLIVLIMYVLFSAYIYEFHRDLLNQPGKVWLVSIQISIVMLLAYLLQFVDIRLAPVVSVALVIGLTSRERVGLTANILVSVLVGMMAGESGQIFAPESFQIAFSNILGGWLAVLVLRAERARTQRGTILVAGAISGALVGLVYLVIAFSEGTGRFFRPPVCGFVSGILSGILGLGLLPVFENVFNILTPMKLMELSNPNQPLLRKLLMEASGTYHHSIVVANLAEQAADAIGANGLLARTASYYHDVGKLKRPAFFKENQMTGDNPHDKIAPELSAMILISHTTDGLNFAKKYKLPKEFQNVIRSHHGTSLTGYFYGKAVQIAAGQADGSVHEADFRYGGPKPQTKEEAVIMLADTVEAASRTLKDHSSESIHAMVEKLVREKLNDGQLDESNLILSDLQILIESFTKTLSSTYHERIEYPELPAQGQKAHPVPVLEPPTAKEVAQIAKELQQEPKPQPKRNDVMPNFSIERPEEPAEKETQE